MSAVAEIHEAAASLGALGFVERVGLRPARGATAERARTTCPAHTDRTPSCDLARRGDRIFWICRSCGERGDALGFVAALEQLDLRADFRRVLQRSAELFGVSLEAVPNTRAPRVARDPVIVLAQAIDAASDAWLAGREMPPLPRASAADVSGALEALRELDAMNAEADARLEALAPAILASIAEREARYLAELNGLDARDGELIQ